MIVPVLAALFTKHPATKAALAAMITGGTTTLVLIIGNFNLPFQLDANIFGISLSAVVYVVSSTFFKKV
jgi:solute:Na+ symporter, SSS family